VIYLDNAATSWPKPPEVLKAMVDVLETAGGNPGRSGHTLSIRAARAIYNAREDIAAFFGAADPMRLVFSANATASLNLAITGLLKVGDHVITTSMEHNSVMRPLRALAKQGVELTVVPCTADGSLKAEDIKAHLRKNTKLVVINYASNVVGTIAPVAQVAGVVHQAGVLLLVDAAQPCGVLPIDVTKDGIDLLAFTGHKGLLGPTGIGGLVIGEGVDTNKLEPLQRGGTGSQSEQEEQPLYLPDKYESGTPNLSGIAGLHAGIKWLKKEGMETVRAREKELVKQLLEGLFAIPNVKIYGPANPDKTVAIVSISIVGKDVSETCRCLDERYGILTRMGLHCAPSAHRTIGSFPEGTLRLAPGVTTTKKDIEKTIAVIAEVAV
jgi:cysteine desulfurase/selenocysteine lyase